MGTRSRPLSPHLSAYKFRITSTLSILHRMTGVALSFGTLVFIAWLLSAATGPEAYGRVQLLIGSIIGQLAIAGWLFAFYYHLGNGVRHLFWDTGRGFEMAQARASGWTVVGFSATATVISWLVAFW